MLIQVYSSNRKSDTYLYVEKDQDLDELPEALVKMLGTVTPVMVVDLSSRNQLALISSQDLAEHIDNDGYWLQLPPTEGHILDSEQCPV